MDEVFDAPKLEAPSAQTISVKSEQVVPYSADTLAMIEIVKNCTTLFDLDNYQWPHTVILTIIHFIETPQRRMLVIYFDNDVLKACLDEFPTVPCHDLTYFRREDHDEANFPVDDDTAAAAAEGVADEPPAQDEPLTPHNFLERVKFGTINNSVIGSAINLLGNIYAPHFAEVTSWPSPAKRDIAKEMHNCLTRFTDKFYQMCALTVIYLPFEVIDMDVMEASRDEDLILRLEVILVHWVHQVRHGLDDATEEMKVRRLLPLAVYDFWVHRYTNLAAMRMQMKCDLVKKTISILRAGKSSYVVEYENLMFDIEHGWEISTCAIQDLQVLKEICNNLTKERRPKNYQKHIEYVLHAYRGLWDHSEFFHSSHRMTSLCHALSNQIIAQCTEYLDMASIFQGKSLQGERELKEIIHCCMMYKTMFHEIEITHVHNRGGVWDVDPIIVFYRINVFIRRCKDMLDVCNCMTLFSRMDKTDHIPYPRYGGTHGSHFERTAEEFDKPFRQVLKNVFDVRHTILDVDAWSWYADKSRFRMEMKRDVGRAVENLMTRVFDEAIGLEEGIDALQGMYYFAKHRLMKKSFQAKVVLVNTILLEEIEQAKRAITSDRDLFPLAVPFFAGRAMLAVKRRKRIDRLVKIVASTEWVTNFHFRNEIQAQYERLCAQVEMMVSDYHYNWVFFMAGGIFRERLNRTLLQRSHQRPGLLEPNFDRTLVQFMQDVDFWDQLKCEVPSSVLQLHVNWEPINVLYERVIGVVLNYNKIIAALSDDERMLFLHLIRTVDRKIALGITRLLWSSEVADLFIVDAAKHTYNLEEFVGEFKEANLSIVRTCEEICSFSLIGLQEGVPPEGGFTFNELKQSLSAHRLVVATDILNKYNSIIKNLIVVNEGFADQIINMDQEWSRYIFKMDNLLEDAFRFCVRSSLNAMYELLHGGHTTGPSSLISLVFCLQDKKLCFKPPLLDIITFVKNTRPDLVQIFSVLPRIVSKFKVSNYHAQQPFHEIIRADAVCSHLQRVLNTEIKLAMEKTNLFVTKWREYKEVWTVNKDMFMQRYEKLIPSASVFDSDTNKYSDIAYEVRIQPSTVAIHFMVVNTDELKEAITDECNVWQKRLTELLLQFFQKGLTSRYEYIRTQSEKVMREPETLVDMPIAWAYFEGLKAEIAAIEEELSVPSKQHHVMSKYGVIIDDEWLDMLNELPVAWREYCLVIGEAEEMLSRKKEKFRVDLVDAVEGVKEAATELVKQFEQEAPFTSIMTSGDALKYLQEMREQLLVLKKKEAQIREDLASFMIAVNPSPKLQQLEQDLASLEAVWKLTNAWDNAWDSYKAAEFWTINTDEMEEKTNNLFRKLTRFNRELKDKNWEIVHHTRQRVDNFRRTLPLITDLKSPALRERHWNQVKQLMKIEFEQNSACFTLESIITMKMMDHAEGINDITNTATLELNIEQGLQTIDDTWQVVSLEMVAAPHRTKQKPHVEAKAVEAKEKDLFNFDELKAPPPTVYSEKEAYRLVAVDDIFQVLEENQMALSSMKSTRFVEPFARTVDYWERTLSYMMELLELFLNVQRQFLYLENIFSGDDIRGQLPRETEVFEAVTNEWCEVTCYMRRERNVFKATHAANLLKKLDAMNTQLENIQRAIEDYLATKRYLFPRFYFISNDDLLEILAQSNTPEKVQPHLKKCFDNINRLKIIEVPDRPQHGVGMISGDGEYIEFVHAIALHGSAEVWLNEVERVMRSTLHEQLRLTRKALRKALSKRDVWIRDWPGQMCITASQIQWTSDCTRTLGVCKAIEEKRPLRSLRKQMNKILQKFSEAIRGTLSTVQRLKVVALVTIEIHARDVIDNLYRTGCMDMNTFDWLAQLRFYWDRDIDNCLIKQTNTCFNYGYEYLGNTGRLVITPLTDRCYITLTTALHLNRGGSPKGPAGTGKTETVKDLGKGLGMYVIVINCSEGLDYKSMGRMFAGLAQTGAWGCFDEFNRINIEVLSVVAQQILSILSALASKLTRFSFEGHDIRLVETCGIFITMNPGYAGRTELPDNLKSMFRPISMIVPDVAMIAEITLFGEGYKNTRVLAKKVFTLFQLAMQQLSKQDHYDFGLRGMVSLLRYAGRKRRANPLLPHEEVILLSMRDMNIAKLTAEDLPLFNGITSDLFPGINTPTLDYEELSAAIIDEFKEGGLQPIPASITKVIQLYETKNSRHSVMIVGKTGSGKSTTWKILRNALSRLKKENVAGYNLVKEYPINPKALSLGELYGEFNLSTNEWLDGVLSAIMRKTCAEETPDQKWIVFDGPVDAVWIENMNSVMDDNKVLTLINSERIVMPEEVSLLFEVEDLAVASPATVSRCGMVYNDYKDLGWQPYFRSWLDKIESEEFVREMRSNFARFIDSVLEFKRLNCKETVAVSELSAVMSLCKMLNCLATKKNGVDDTLDKDKFEAITKCWFQFCFVWTICGSVDEDGRKKLDVFVREKEGTFPLKDTIYDYSVDVLSRCFILWDVQLSSSWHIPKGLPFFKIIVPTVDTLRYRFLVSALLEHGYPGLLVGPVGTGKTLCALNVLESLDSLKYCVLMVNMSAQTTSNNVQDMVESRVEKRTKGVYVPAGDKTLITFMDDLNMPAKEAYGSQPPLELIRQWIDYGFWYDRQKQEHKHVKEMLLLAAMGPPGGGRNVITNRLLSRFNVINMTFPSDTQIERIFVTMLEENLAQFNEEMAFIYISLTKASIELYKSVINTMLPTPSKTHYLFNLRDISKIFQGVLRGDKEAQDSKTKILRLWVHECSRVFSDRLIDEHDQDWFVSEMNEQLGKHFNVTYHSICHNKESPIFCDFVNSFVYEEQNVPLLRKHIEKCLQDFNSSPGTVRMDLVLFKDALAHICRVVRVISQPRGNMLLVGIGGSGRQSMAKLAAFISEYSLFEIEVTKNYRVKEFREDMKALYKMAGVELKPTTFLFNDTQIADEGFLEIINNVLSSGEVPNLYKPEEFDEVKNLLQKAADKKKIQPTREAMFTFLIDRVRENLHIVLCMSPVGDSFRNRLRQYPSLVNCTTIDWFHEWPQEALLEVAHKYLAGINFLETLIPVDLRRTSRDAVIKAEQERLTDSVAGIFALIHDSVFKCSRQMLLEMKRPNYVTPTNYLELVTGYKGMLAEKRVQIALSANKLRNGLFKIDDTREKVALMAVELEEAQVLVGEYQQQCDEYLVVIKKQSTEADEKKEIVAARSIKIEEEEVACQKLADAAQADLNEAMPALEEAMRALDALNKKDLTEIRSYGRPPPKVEMVMEAVMIMKKVDPSWAEAKRQLGEQNFLKDLREFDKDNISDRTLKRIGHYTRNVDFDPEKVGIVSFAAKSLCLWVIAIEKYGKLYRVVAPKRARLDEAMAFLQRKQQSLAEAKDQLAELALKLLQLQKEYDEKIEQKEQLRIKAEMLEQKLVRAGQLVDGLAGEKVRWEATVESLDRTFLLLPGDCLIATAFVSYLGPFVTTYRDTLGELWKKNIVEFEIPMSPGMSIASFLSDPTTIREWNIQGLPSDEFSTENGIIVTRAIRWPLLIDPQCQGVKWIRNMEASKNLKVIDLGQRDFMKELETSIQLGRSLLLENVMEELDPSLRPVLNRSFVKQGGTLMLKINDKLVTYNPDFRFFITTKLGNPHFAPEISTKTTLVNFAVKEQGLEAQLLGIVVRKEKPVLEEQKDSLVMNIATGKRMLLDLEDELLRLLNETKGSLLDDLELLITLQTSKATSVSVSEQLAIAEVTEVEIDTAREGYRPCAQRASILFFVVNDMSRIDPMYQFSLDSYIMLYLHSIQKSKKSDKLADRIYNLNDYHTYSVYRNTCRGLFEKHKLLFSFHMTVKILQAQGMINAGEYSFLLKGGVVLDRQNQVENPSPNWMTDLAWDCVTELDKISGFHGVVNTFQAHRRDWHRWYTHKTPESQPLMGEWDANCTEFQRMLFVRSLRLDRIPSCVTAFVANTLHPQYIDPPVLDLRAVLDDSSTKTPLIFVLSPGVDPTGQLVALAEASGMIKNFHCLSLGQGQAPIATQMIRKGCAEGNWVYLANCHLSLSWMPKLSKLIDALQIHPVHKRFRLWLSSSPAPEFPISILQAGIKMTTEPPKGLKPNLKRLYGLITDDMFVKCESHVKYRRLLFSLCYFHAILLERKKFQKLGWNVDYSFNDSDFLMSESLLSNYLDEYEQTPWEALKYLIADVNYGGHVTDDWDRRLLNTYINQYFCNNVLNIMSYRLASSPTYYVPNDGSLLHYIDYVIGLPSVDEPEAFGQHSNADITSLISETRTLFETLMSLQVQVTQTKGDSKEDQVLKLSADVLSKVPEPINYEQTAKLMGIEKTPLDVVLLQEIARYNTLLVTIRSSLVDLQRGIKGLVVMSSYLEDIFVCIYEGRVPQGWLKTYPSLKLLGSWTRDLGQRVEHFGTWAKTTHAPQFFWLSAFTFPTGFLTAVLQVTARQANISIDSLAWEFAVFTLEERFQGQPSDGVYVRGMFLEGAGWDNKGACLMEPQPMQLVCPMPIIHFKPVEPVKRKTANTHYACPVYYYPMRCGAPGRPAFIVEVELKTGLDPPEHWIKRATALLLSLAE